MTANPTILLALTAAVFGACGDDAMTLRVVERADTDKVTDLGMPGDSVGDVLTFANPIFDETNRTQLGTNSGYCIRTDVGKTWECTWTLFLPEGQITVAGPFFDTRDSVLAITGGSGAYNGAQGEMALHARTPMGTEYDFTYSIASVSSK
jgi:allene oxide cyclase